MKKLILLIASFWLALFDIQPTYGMPLVDALNTLSTNFKALGDAFSGKAIPTPASSPASSDEKQLITLTQSYQNNLQLALTNPEDFLEKANNYINTVPAANRNRDIELWYNLLTVNNWLKNNQNKALEDIARDNNITPQQVIGALTVDFKLLEGLSATAADESTITQTFYSDTMNKLSRFLPLLEYQVKQPEKPQLYTDEEKWLLDKIKEYRDDLTQGRALINTMDFLNRANNYLSSGKKDIVYNIALWYGLINGYDFLYNAENLTLGAILNKFPHKFKTQKEIIADLQAQILYLKAFEQIAIAKGSIKIYNQIFSRLNKLLTNFTAEAHGIGQAETEEQQLVTTSQQYRDNLQQRTPNVPLALAFPNEQTFLDEAGSYLQVAQVKNPQVNFWYNLLNAQKFLENNKNKSLIVIAQENKVTPEALANRLQKGLLALEGLDAEAHAEGAKAYDLYNDVKNKLGKLIPSIEGPKQSSEEQQLIDLTNNFVKNLHDNKDLENVEDFINRSIIYLQAHEPAVKSDYIILWYDLLDANKFVKDNATKSLNDILKDNKFNTPQDLIDNLTDLLNGLKSKQNIIQLYQNDDVTKFYNDTIKNLDTFIQKIQSGQSKSPEKPKEVTAAELESQLKDFIVTNFSSPLASTAKQENFAQFKMFNANYKALTQKAAAQNYTINPLITFWYAREFIKYYFANNNLLAATFEEMGNSSDASINTMLSTFKQLQNVYENFDPAASTTIPDNVKTQLIGNKADAAQITMNNYTILKQVLDKISTQLDYQKKLIDIIKANFSNPEKGLSDVTMVGGKIITSNLAEPAKMNSIEKYVSAYFDFLNAYPNMSDSIVKPYKYWYYRSVLLSQNIGQFSDKDLIIEKSGDKFARTHFGKVGVTNRLQAMLDQYNAVKPDKSLDEKVLKGTYFLNNQQQAAAGDQIIESFVATNKTPKK